VFSSSQGCQIGSFGAKNQEFGSFEKQLAPTFLFGYFLAFLQPFSFHKCFLEKSFEWCVKLVPATTKRKVGHHSVCAMLNEHPDIPKKR